MLLIHLCLQNTLNEMSDSYLHEMVRYGDVDDVITALVNHSSDVNVIGLYQWNPVHEAAHNGYSLILKTLLEHGGIHKHCCTIYLIYVRTMMNQYFLFRLPLYYIWIKF